MTGQFDIEAEYRHSTESHVRSSFYYRWNELWYFMALWIHPEVLWEQWSRTGKRLVIGLGHALCFLVHQRRADSWVSWPRSDVFQYFTCECKSLGLITRRSGSFTRKFYSQGGFEERIPNSPALSRKCLREHPLWSNPCKFFFVFSFCEFSDCP